MAVFQKFKICQKTGEKVLDSKKWHYSFRQKSPSDAPGRQNRKFQGSTGCSTKRAAEAFERSLRNEIASGAYDQRETSPTVGDILLSYFTERWAGHSKAEAVSTQLETIARIIGDDTLIVDLTHQAVASAVKTRATERCVVFVGRDESGNKILKPFDRIISPATANREFENLQSAINHAIINGLTPPPIKWDALWLETAGDIQHELSDEQSIQYMAAIRPDYRPFVVFLRTSAKRVSEVINLKKSDVRRKEMLVRYRLKGGEILNQKVTPMQMDILISEMRKAPGNFVWSFEAQVTQRYSGTVRMKGDRYPVTYTSFRTIHRKTRDQIGMPELRIHDLRHDTLTKITRESDGNIGKAMALAGHKSINTTKRYVHFAGQDQSAAADLATEVLAGIGCSMTAVDGGLGKKKA